MRGTSNINKTSTTSSWILKGPLTGSGTQRYVQLYNTNANLINIMQQLYDRTSNAVYLDDRLGDWLRTTVGVKQGCLLSPTLFVQHLLIRTKSWMMHWKTSLEQSVREAGQSQTFCWRYWWTSRWWAGTRQISGTAGHNLSCLRYGDQCRENQVDGQHRWHQCRHQSQWRETRDCQ